MARQRPEPGVEYFVPPSAEHRAHCSAEAVRSLAKAWGVTETRAADLLADPDEYRAEYRSRGVSARDARAIMDARRDPPS